MINLAVVIAVSDYEISPLPGCRNDGAAVAMLLDLTGKFNEVLFIARNATSATVKTQLVDFIARHKGSSVDDFIFYFTGHGDFYDGEFYYLLEDYQAARRKQTCLENSELDNLVRSLKPKLFAKIIDACHSGLPYVKDGGDLRKHLDASASSFSKIYFMFSSQTAQASYQDETLSYFTRRLIESVALRGSPFVRYKDVIDYISDAFASDAMQTPFFVTQADHVEVFVELPEDKRENLKQYLPLASNPAPETELHTNAAPQHLSLFDLIKSDAQQYCTEQETISALQRVAALLNQYKLPADLADLYSLRLAKVGEADFQYGTEIGKWLDKNRSDKSYFARPLKEMRPVERKVLKNRFSIQIFENLGDDDYKTITEYKEFIVGMEPSVSLPFAALTIFADPKLLNLLSSQMHIVPIVSMTHIRFFWSYVHLNHASWKEKRFVNAFEWTTDEAPTKDIDRIETLLMSIADGFEAFILAALKAKWGKAGAIENVTTPEVTSGTPPAKRRSRGRRVGGPSKQS